ncbi:ketosteroid isomerase-like protein [Mycolicibacterium phlei]|jgi:steroid delta-isomerase|uniref:Steroid delta-isomerase n=1 Tax=Mycolicibacterium phlei DSM 43239 = CCUG 21000 TaxID=1226750 RepID=A0A5N5V2D8_MYCPH|nr:nuclear transport factor 2 family protein [Mycolicibacterium phlei]VEG11141.1 ketosteroid isomerase-like protein [Mycobacteroides chelonae]AMO63043.1 Steroid Delta-isomerase [Mycolicibacterium phlei]EID17270.1 ketosteroid isomerase-like protein [Mycolicibacterium phlei RIVM601174]KAB7756052.1 steroid delta-isomerase [Mycolicibacterium phlei DSM 43239 = CCUG 21000]KXW65716.1 steroid delta-isomerase [Mycolicibacterium phlei DSM 43239 = CCUG 21000]
MSTPEANAKTVARYLELVGQGNADEVAKLYADDATVEDPVGSEVHIGRTAIRGFYQGLPPKADTEIITLRALGHEVAFFWALTIDLGESKMRMEIISVMTFNSDGEIASMKAYWTPENITQG